MLALSYLNIPSTHIETDNLTTPTDETAPDRTHNIPSLGTLSYVTDKDLDQQAIEQYIAYMAKKKYKPVAQKVKSVVCELPGKFRILRKF